MGILQLTNQQSANNLWLRILTAMWGVPLIIFVIYIGSIYLDLLLITLLGVIFHEWSSLSLEKKFHPFCTVMVGLISYYAFLDGTFLEILAASLTIGTGFIFLAKIRRPYIFDRFLFVTTALYISAAINFLIYLNHTPEISQGLILWVFILVWTADTGAYFTGRAIGGPKLAPSISPKKTWSGFIGGSVLSFCTCLWTLEKLSPEIHQLIQTKFILGMPGFIGILVLFSHLGDLAESALKRYYNAKDSGSIIPGHGGFLDRFDSLLMVLIVLAVILHFLS